MGYYRDATAKEVEGDENLLWTILPPVGVEDLPEQERWRVSFEEGERVNPRIWVEEPMDAWTTPVEVVMHSGFKPEALLGLFGPTDTAPDGTQGWLIEHVERISETVIDAAVTLLHDSLTAARLEDHFPPPSRVQEWPTPAEAAAAVAALDLPSMTPPITTASQ